MQMPALNDAILAVASGGDAAPLGILRLSGPDSFMLARELGLQSPPEIAAPEKTAHAPFWNEGRARLDEDLTLPATVFWFRGPRSYTGQDLVEIHVPGCPPLLRVLAARLLTRGARAALPGEFTARAFLAGKLDAGQVEGVLSLLHASHQAAARRAARSSGGSYRPLVDELLENLTNLLALIEAGIDFVEEEDITFVTPAEVCGQIDQMRAAMAALPAADPRAARGGKPHVALVGLPNAGKSALFNALLEHERAIVSPMAGATRDVLSAELEIEGVALVLQDCAGLGRTVDELELAAHRATERTADQADLVVWVHDAATSWDAREIEACRRIPAARRVLTFSKADLLTNQASLETPLPFEALILSSAATKMGLSDLRRLLARRLEQAAGERTEQWFAQELQTAAAALSRARETALTNTPDLKSPEIVALELRTAYECLEKTRRGPLVEEVLARIFSNFCVGK